MSELFSTNPPVPSASDADNNPYANGNFSQAPGNSYPINSYFQQEEKKVKEETPLTKRMKSQFSFFGLASMIYAFFYAFCLYKNASGITYPFFVAGTLYYFFLSMKKLGVPYKKDSLFYMISILLLGISNCCTDSPQLLRLNKLGIFLLAFILILHTVYHDIGWNFPKYIGAILLTIKNTVSCIFSPMSDMVSFFDAKKQEKNDENNNFVYIMLGIAASIPVLAIMIVLLCSADVVFENILKNLISFDISFTDIIKIGLLVAVVFLASYALLAALCRKAIKEEVSDKKVLEPIIAIIVTGMLSVLYLAFSMVQILYLFIGNMQLPEGYTYSTYARQGFFQLLAVCIINLILVLFCLSFFKDNIILKVILSIISGCTFIMILSSALRMIMYINKYNLTFLRIFVLWALVVIFLLMVGVTVYIYFQRFPLFFYSVSIATVFYIGLSFAHPDYWIARYNLAPARFDNLNEYEILDSREYLTRLSADAAPVILNETKNSGLAVDVQTLKQFAILQDKYRNDDEETSYNKYYEVQDQIKAAMDDSYRYSTWTYDYYQKIFSQTKQMHVRNFNFSRFFAKISAGL